MRLKMQTNKIDKHIADKLKNRELTPSASAWERLSNQLDEQQVFKKNNWFKYVGYAASVLLIVSLGLTFLSKNNIEKNHQEIISNIKVDTLKIKEFNVKELLPVEEAIVKKEKKNKSIFKKKKVKYSNNKVYETAKVEEELNKTKSPKSKKVFKEVTTLIANADKKVKKQTITVKKERVKSRVKVNGDDLLFAVTHSPQEVQEYYAKYKINRKEVLNTIQEELIKSNLKIDPETILAEVELDIEETDFQQNFMNKFKVKLSDVIVAFADRNK